MVFHRLYEVIKLGTDQYYRDGVQNHAEQRRGFNGLSKGNLRKQLWSTQHFSIVALLLQFDIESNPGPGSNPENVEDRKEDPKNPGAPPGTPPSPSRSLPPTRPARQNVVNITLPALPKFPRDPTSKAVERWIQAISTRARMQSWTPDTVESCLVPLLSDSAVDLFYSLEKESRGDWAYVLKLVEEEFVGNQVTGSGQREFLRATLGPRESLTDFYWRLTELGRRAFPGAAGEQEAMLTEAFLRGLPQSYQTPLVPIHYENSRAALRAAQRIEGFYPGTLRSEFPALGDPVFQVGGSTPTGGRGQPPVAPGPEESRMDRLEKSIVALTTTVGDALKVICEKVSAKKEEAPRKEYVAAAFSGICYGCGERGHIKRFCRNNRNPRAGGWRPSPPAGGVPTNYVGDGPRHG